MKGIFVLSVLIAVVAAGNWNTNDRNNRNNLTERDGKHQKFVLDLLRHLQHNINQKDFMQYSNTIRLDNKNDYKNLNKVYHMVSLFQNGWFVQRGKPFSLFRERNVVTTKALFDFFDTMNDWNTCAMNLIWARRNINEYQFWHLVTLLVTHNRHFDNLVLPSFYEVFPTQFFTVDVMDRVVNQGYNLDMKNNKFVIMSNYTTGVLGSNDDDDNNNVYDLNDIKHGNNKINDWYTLKKVMNDIKNQLKMSNNMMMTNRKNKDIKNEVNNNNRQLNQGNKFDNNGEDRLVYFTEDIGLNNYYYFSRMANSRIVDNNQMYNNINNKENFNMKNGKLINNKEINGKVSRRGERYLYQMKQLLARFNLERKCNGLDNVRDISLDGIIENGVYPNLRYTNGLQMTNRQNDYYLKKQHNMKLIQVTKDFENRFIRAIDQGYIQSDNGQKITLQTKDGINILGNLLQGNRDSVNIQYYRYLEYYYRLLFGGSNNDNIDFNDKRFVPTVLDHHETAMRDSVFWQVIKRITNIVNKFQTKLTGYTSNDVNFNGVKITNVKVDKLVTTFNFFDADITNGINMGNNFMCNKNVRGNSDESNDSNDSNDSSDSNSSSGSDSDSNESNDSYGNGQINNNRRFNRNGQNFNNKNWNKNFNNRNRQNFNNKNFNNKNFKKNNHNGRNVNGNSDSSSSSSESNSSSNSDSNSSSKESNENNKNHYGNNKHMNNKYMNQNKMNNKYMNQNKMNNKYMNNYRNENRNNQINRNKIGDNFNNYGTSKQVNYYKRSDNMDNMSSWKYNIVGRTRRMDTKQFTVTVDVQSNKNQYGIVRIFLGTRINNKQQLNDNRNNFVELDQFVVKLNQGQNLIKRNSFDFKNVVGDGVTMSTLYYRTLNFLNKKNNGKDLYGLNFDTMNNNRGFPHRLVLPKGTVGGEDFTLFVIVSDLNNHNNGVHFKDNMGTVGNKFYNGNNDNSNDSSDSNDSSNSNDSSDSSDSNDSSNSNSNSQEMYNNRGNNKNYKNMNSGKHFNKNWNQNGKFKNFNDYNINRNGNFFKNNNNNDLVNNNNDGGNWYKTNDGIMIHNNNNQKKNFGNGNGVLDTRTMGFPLDRQIIDVNGFITNNMFFKDVTVYHIDDNTNVNNYKNDNNY